MKSKLLALVAFLCFTFVLAAANVSGKWTAEVPGRGGNTQSTTFNFTVSGDVLTGTVSGGRGGDAPISDGKVSGDTVSFTQTLNFNGNEIKISYTGKVSGDTIEFTRDAGRGGPVTFTAKRAQ